MNTPDVMEHRGDFRLADALVMAIDAVMARDNDPRAYVDELLAAIPDGWAKWQGKWVEIDPASLKRSTRVGQRVAVLLVEP